MLKYSVLQRVIGRGLVKIVTRFWQSVKELISKVVWSVIHSKPVVKFLWKDATGGSVNQVLGYSVRKFIEIILKLHYDLILVSCSWEFSICLVHEADNGTIEVERSIVVFIVFGII